MTDTPLRNLPAWIALGEHHKKIESTHLSQLFAEDPTRGERYAIDDVGIYLDYSKNRVTDETLKLLIQLAEQSGLKAKIDAMFAGEKINISEGRSVLHVALRAPKGAKLVVDGQDVVAEVHAVLDKMSAFADRVRAANGRATPVNASAISSMSASVVPISVRSWPMRRFASTARATWSSASSPISTGPTSPRR